MDILSGYRLTTQKLFGAFSVCYKKIFIIGNGFDLNFKLPTSPDNYKNYLESFTIEGSSGSSSALDFLINILMITGAIQNNHLLIWT